MHTNEKIMLIWIWPCNEKRRHECCKASKNDEGGREETSRKAQTDVDGQSASYLP